MKPHLLPLVISFGVLAVLGHLARAELRLTESDRTKMRNKESEVKTINQKLDRLTQSYNQQRAESAPQEAFLLLWSDDHNKFGAVAGDVLRSLAEANSLTVTELKRDDGARKVKSGGYEFHCDRYSIKVLGPYTNVLRFVGALEKSLSTASIQSLTMGRNLNDVALHMQIVVPRIEHQSSSS